MNPDEPHKVYSEEGDSVADIVRQKIENIYKEAPDAKQEEQVVENTATKSKHQKFMQDLMDSGKNINQIQTEWHQYYLALPDTEKKEVWDEFYASNTNIPKPKHKKVEPAHHLSTVKNQVVTSRRFDTQHEIEIKRTPGRKSLRKNAGGPHTKLKARHYFQSLLFGLSMGIIVLVVFLFSFFNEIIIAPLIQPSRTNEATPIIVGSGDLTASNVDQVIIPKINVEIPVNYSVATTNENAIENYLQDGVIHYPDTVEPGQLGNAAFFGHSSNNIFNAGKYKFAFVLLHTLLKGDTFYLTYNHTLYIYKVVNTFIVAPSDVSVLGSVSGQSATATLITCDPPGTSLNRLIVIGAQISPSVSTDTAGTNTISATKATNYLPGNGPTLWSRFIGSDGGKTAVVVVGVGLIIIIFRRTANRNVN